MCCHVVGGMAAHAVSTVQSEQIGFRVIFSGCTSPLGRAAG